MFERVLSGLLRLYKYKVKMDKKILLLSKVISKYQCDLIFYWVDKWDNLRIMILMNYK